MKKFLFFFFACTFVIQAQTKKNTKDTDNQYVTFALKKVETSIKAIYDEIEAEEYGLDFEVFRYAYIGYQSLKNQNRLNEKEIFSIIDFSKDANSKRFFTIDLENKQVIYHTYVTHGRKSGDRLTNSFSDIKESNKSSLGFYITGNTYIGSKGYSLQLHGDEKGYNSNMAQRGVVIHTADYANEDYIKRNGRLGRSLGCPVLPENIYKQVIETIKEKTMIFAYYNDAKYLKTSRYLNLLKLVKEDKFVF